MTSRFAFAGSSTADGLAFELLHLFTRTLYQRHQIYFGENLSNCTHTHTRTHAHKVTVDQHRNTVAYGNLEVLPSVAN